MPDINAIQPPAIIPDQVVYEDSALLVVNKPHGVLSVPGKNDQASAYTRAKQTRPYLRVVHRLDMNTSGLLLFAQSPKAQTYLSQLFEKKHIIKEYECIVHGEVSFKKGHLNWPIAPSNSGPKQQISPLGKPSTTLIQTLESNDHFSRLLIRPFTGRTHQIRVHLAALGHPILGDDLYSEKTIEDLPILKGQNPLRMHLHARLLRLPHPENGRLITIEASTPF